MTRDKVGIFVVSGLIAVSIGVLINYYFNIISIETGNKILAVVILLFAGAGGFYLLVAVKDVLSQRGNSNGYLRGEENSYVPNVIPFSTQAWHAVISSVLMLYGTYGIMVGDIYIPGKRSKGVHFHGISAWFVYFSFIFATCNLMSVIVDHYDRRNNEKYYQIIAKVFGILGWSLFVVAFLIKIFVK